MKHYEYWGVVVVVVVVGGGGGGRGGGGGVRRLRLALRNPNPSVRVEITTHP